MIHALITLALAALAWPIGLHAEAEYRAIKSFYGGKRDNAPWRCWFERRAWDVKSMADWLGPVAVSVVAIAM